MRTRPARAETMDTKYARLRDILHECGSVCIGYSGGVDSVLLARVAVDTLGASRVLAVTGRSAAYPQVQRAVAVECAARFGIPHLEIDTDELADPSYTANPANRCYFCKAELWPKLRAVAAARGFDTVLDGSNADDASDYRPGFAAARENGVRSPLLEAGLTKAEVRALSRGLGLPTWDQPSSPCLSSRLPYGVAVTPERLRQVEQAEASLRELGYREFRVRHHGDCARVEFAPDELSVAWRDMRRIRAALLAAGIERVLIDVEGYRRGALNEALVQLGTPPIRAQTMDSDAGTTSGGVDGSRGACPGTAGQHQDIAVLPAASLAQARARALHLRDMGYRYIAVDAGA